MTAAPTPRISVVVPVFNGGEMFGACLDHVLASGFPDHEVVVVDDASTDGAVPAPSGRVRVIRHDRNRGVSAARNRGAVEAAGEIIVFLDADVLVPPDFLARIAAAFDAAPGLGCLQATCAPVAANRGFAPALLALSWRHGWLRGGASASALNSYAFAIRRSLFLESGGFDQRFGTALGGEEVEYGYRLSRVARLEVDPSLEVRHRFQRFWPRTRSLFLRARRHGLLLLSARTFPSHGGGRPVEMAMAAVATAGAAVAPFSPAIAAGTFLLYAVLRLPLLSFIRRHRGAAFALAGLPALWVWSLAGGLGVALGILSGLLGKRVGAGA